MPDTVPPPAEPEEGRTGHRTYAETVAAGHYGKNVGGLSGKYDNVRTYWEDELTRRQIRPFVKAALRSCGPGRGLRVLDLGCGAGQGLELLTRIPEKDLNMDDAPRYVLPAGRVGSYLGLDLSSAMVEQGRENHSDQGRVRFLQADLDEGLGPAAAEEPFDLYFSSYGALSHLQAKSLRRLVVEIGRHARPGAVVVLDLVGRYSLEWTGYWRARDESEKVRQYAMSYLYEESQRDNGEVESFPLRFWTGEEVRDLCRELGARSGVRFRPSLVLDRSLFVGRHVDTREYGCTLPPLRGLTNRLFEQNVRTRLEDLLVPGAPTGGVPELDAFYATLTRCWNQLLEFSLERIGGARVDLVDIPGWREFPPELQLALMTMDRIVDSVAWIDVGDPRANILEPQLGYVLCRLEAALQRGMGCGHGLVAVLQLEEKAAA